MGPRIEGFRQAWLESGRDEAGLTQVPIPWSHNSFEVALNVRRYFKDTPPNGDYFVTDGKLATSFIEVLGYLGAQVPGSVGVIGYDGAQRGELTDPPMTTIQQDMEQIAQNAVSRIREIPSGNQETGVLERIPPILVSRGSF